MGRIKNVAKFVAPIFKDNSWVWLGENGEVPTESTIVHVLKGLKKDAIECKGWAETGRLLARYDNDSERVEYYLALPDDGE